MSSPAKQRRATRRGPGRPAGAPTGEGRDALLAAARSLMAEKGFPRVTLREVAERADVGAALVSYYFGSKDGLLREVVAEVAGEAAERIQHAVTRGGSVVERVSALIHSWIDAMAADPYAARLLIEQVLFAEDDVIETFVDRFARPNLVAIGALMKEGHERGELREIDPVLLMPSLVGICLFFFLGAPIVQRVSGMGEFNSESVARYADSAAELVLHGISLPQESQE